MRDSMYYSTSNYQDLYFSFIPSLSSLSSLSQLYNTFFSKFALSTDTLRSLATKTERGKTQKGTESKRERKKWSHSLMCSEIMPSAKTYMKSMISLSCKAECRKISFSFLSSLSLFFAYFKCSELNEYVTDNTIFFIHFFSFLFNALCRMDNK